MDVYCCTYVTAAGGKDSGLATSAQPMWVIGSSPMLSGTLYGCEVLWCPRNPKRKAVSLNTSDIFKQVLRDEWPDEVYAGIAKRILLGADIE
jgi:hypothetical protein